MISNLTQAQEQQEFVVDADKRRLFDFQEIWHYKELFYFFTWRDIKIKYKQTALGFLWAILQPLLMMVIFTFFFGRALNVPSQNLPYPVFVFSGLLLWNTFSTGLTNSANSMINNAQIIKKIYFPRLVIPVSSILVAVFDFMMAFVLFIPILIFYQQPVAFSALWSWPLAILVTLTATLGPGTLLAALNVKYRDFRYVIPFLVQVLFFLTPVIYPVSMLKYPVLQYVIVLSPMYAAIELFRYPLTGAELNSTFILLSLASSVIILFAGLLYFKRTEDFFADFA
ncbi:ABC transporter permease [Chryseolinea sp. H1M3-3]|uniref:ABC transporter permease n=1 Tax=Chryseolinea sp. H1M3-3 TaxID=3034144 RepID=UPI0023EA9CB7|nr:ABC transporter permease [Chryseolinea sp. H1M3-3]